MDEKFNFELFEAEKLPKAVSDENNNEPQNPEYNDITAGSAPKKKKKLPKKAKALMIICAVLACVIIAGAITLIYPLLSAKHSPDRFVASYVSSVIDGDWEKVYKNSSFFDSPFITRESFAEYCKTNPDAFAINKSKITDYKIERDRKDGNINYYSLNYITESGEQGVYYITLQMTKDGFYKYDTYKAMPIEGIITRAVIYAPQGTEISINGNAVKSTNIITPTAAAGANEYSYSEYKSDYLFAGSYEITATNAAGLDYSQTADISSDNNIFYIALEVDESSALYDRAKSAIETLYRGALQNSINTDELGISKSFEGDKFLAVLKDAEDEIYYTNENLSVSDFEITNAKCEKAGSDKTYISYNSNGETDITISFDYKYTLSNKVDGTSEEKTNTGFATIKFIYQNSAYVIDNIASRAEF